MGTIKVTVNKGDMIQYCPDQWVRVQGTKFKSTADVIIALQHKGAGGQPDPLLVAVQTEMAAVDPVAAQQVPVVGEVAPVHPQVAAADQGAMSRAEQARLAREQQAMLPGQAPAMPVTQPVAQQPTAVAPPAEATASWQAFLSSLDPSQVASLRAALGVPQPTQVVGAPMEQAVSDTEVAVDQYSGFDQETIQQMGMTTIPPTGGAHIETPVEPQGLQGRSVPDTAQMAAEQVPVAQPQVPVVPPPQVVMPQQVAAAQPQPAVAPQVILPPGTAPMPLSAKDGSVQPASEADLQAAKAQLANVSQREDHVEVARVPGPGAKDTKIRLTPGTAGGV